MGFASTHNKGSKFSIDSTNFPFISLNELELDTEYPVKGVYILTKRGKMKEDMPNLITDDSIINLPHHLIDDVKDILASDEYINQIENGGLSFKVYEYEDSNKEIRRSITWIDNE